MERSGEPRGFFLFLTFSNSSFLRMYLATKPYKFSFEFSSPTGRTKAVETQDWIDQ